MRNDEVKMAKEKFKSFLDVCDSRSLNLIKQSIKDNNSSVQPPANWEQINPTGCFRNPHLHPPDRGAIAEY